MTKYTPKMVQVSISSVNRRVADEPALIVSEAEDKFAAQISEACRFVVEKNCSFVFLAGPSSSGKTTASKMMVEGLEAMGKTAIRVSLDNFYKDRDDLPLWRNGRRNYESIKGLDLDYFKELLDRLKADNHADFPVFDFTEGKRGTKTFSVVLTPETYLIFEGIHALNPIFEEIAGESCSVKIYISPHSDYVDDNGGVVLSGRNLRLIRRLLRDNSVRNAGPNMTFDMWEDVVKGEVQYIAPYRKHADLHINSTHAYEPGVYKDMLLSVFEGYDAAKEFESIRDELLLAVKAFSPLSKTHIPKNSLLREFVPSILS